MNRNPAARRKDRMRERIKEIANELYEHNGGSNGGFEATTVESIAAGADISVRTFFRYFNNKASVLFFDPEVAIHKLRSAMERKLLNTSPVSALLSVSLDQADRFTSDPVDRHRLRRSLVASQFVEQVALWRDMERRELAAQVAPYCDPHGGDQQMAAAILVATVRGAYHAGLDRWAQSSDTLVRDVLITAFADLRLTSEAISVSSGEWLAGIASHKPNKGR